MSTAMLLQRLFGLAEGVLEHGGHFVLMQVEAEGGLGGGRVELPLGGREVAGVGGGHRALGGGEGGEHRPHLAVDLPAGPREQRHLDCQQSPEDGGRGQRGEQEGDRGDAAEHGDAGAFLDGEEHDGADGEPQEGAEQGGGHLQPGVVLPGLIGAGAPGRLDPTGSAGC